jgi:GNAT superfamily N-acetyltransferase
MIRPAQFPVDLAAVRELFEEYADSIGISLCFQGFDAEVAGLPGAYAPPAGRLLLAEWEGRIAGCVALRPLPEGRCEMKRLFVRPAFRGHGIARRLVQRLLQEARGARYRAVRLDTLPIMGEARALYRSLGFVEIAPYTNNPVEGVLFLELDLVKQSEEGNANR